MDILRSLLNELARLIVLNPILLYVVLIIYIVENYVKMIFKHRELQEMQEQNEYNQEKYEQDELDKSNYDYVQKSFWSGERVIKRL